MQIQLKQTEIVTALKQYIHNQGINLTGKEVTIAFTAGRKESGISAELTIEDSSIPGFSEADSVVAPVTLTVVPSDSGNDRPAEGDSEPEPVAKTPTGLFS